MAEGYEPVKTPLFAGPRRWAAVDRMFRELFETGGAAVLTLLNTEIVAGVTGTVSQLRSTIPDATFYKVSGPATIQVSPEGLIATTAAIPLNQTVTLTVRVEGPSGFAIEKRFVLTASIIDVSPPAPPPPPPPPPPVDAKVVAFPAPATTPPNFDNLTTSDTDVADTDSNAQFWEFQPQNVGFFAYFCIGETGAPLFLTIANDEYLFLGGVPGNQYAKIGEDIHVDPVSDPANGKIRASLLPNGDFEVLQDGVRKSLISKATIIAANPDAYNADRTSIRFRSDAEFTNVTGGAYAVLYKPVSFASVTYDSLGFVDAVIDYYMPINDFLTIEVLTGDGAGTLIDKVNAEVVEYPQAGRVRLRSKSALSAAKRGFPTRIRITQATSGETATQSGVVWAAAPSFATNPNASNYYYLNAPTANKNVGSWRGRIDGGNDTIPPINTAGTPVASAFANGGRPVAYIGGMAAPSQRMRLQIDSDMTGLDTRNNGGGASITDVSGVSSANGESFVDFTFNWDQVRYYRGEWQVPGQSLDVFLMQIQPLGATAYTNCRIYEINDDGSRRSPGYWDVDHIAINSRYAKFQFGSRLMDMQSTVDTAFDPNPRITQAGDIGQTIRHSTPDLLGLLTATGNTGRFHIPLQATEAWVRTEARRTAKWAKLHMMFVMWTLANEIWNSGQPAWRAVAGSDELGGSDGLAARAVAAGKYVDTGGSQHDKVLRYWSFRHKEVMTWVMEEFIAEGVADLLVCNVDLHNDGVALAPQVCEAEPGIAPYIQSISTAPYIGGYKGIDLSANDLATLVTRIKNDVPIVYGRAAQNRDYAVSKGWAFFEYEGGFEDIGNGQLWHNLLASQEGYDLLKYMITEHQRIVGGNQTFYTDYRPTAWGLTHHVGQTATFPPERPSMLAKAWYEAMAAV